MAKTGHILPTWTEQAGGRAAWKKWLDIKVNSCVRRASKWAEQRGILPEDLPTPAQWRAAILSAMEVSAGVAHYSGLPLSVAPPRKGTDWNWPSVDHTANPGVAQVVLETRLVNDMKTIMSETEFRQMVGHLAAVFGIEPAKVSMSWSCRRSFAVEQLDEEPALPE